MKNLPPEERITIETYDRVASIWDEKYSPPGFWSEELRKFHELLPAGRVLEIGTGSGRDAKELLAMGYDYVGTDPSVALLALAKNELPDTALYQQSVYELSFPNLPKFDGFWASKSLLHIPKKHIGEAVLAIKAVMRPGAIGFISLKDGQGEGLESEPWDDDNQYSRYFAYWTKNEFTEALSQNGFETADYMLHPENGKFNWHCFFVNTV